jgi:1-acyl-sn-glycerol-3-phosphate acyltransferase
MIRFIFLNAFIGFHSLIFCLWGFLLSFFDRDGHLIHAYVAVPWAKVILWVCGIQVRTTGRENLAPKVSRVYMTNHQSYFDIFALLANLSVDFKFILKQELMKIPFLGLAMRKARYIGIEREDPRKAVKSMADAAERIKSGASVVIFPEGTRSVDGRLQPFKKGGFSLALKAGCDIVPVVIIDSYRIVPKGSLRINKGSFDMHIGEPISVIGFNKRNIGELMDLVRRMMQEEFDKRRAPSSGQTLGAKHHEPPQNLTDAHP